MKSMKALLATVALLLVSLFGLSAFAAGFAPGHHGGGEDSLVIPSEIDTQMFFGMPAARLLQLGLGV
jgi:hypothetical protein